MSLNLDYLDDQKPHAQTSAKLLPSELRSLWPRRRVLLIPQFHYSKHGKHGRRCCAVFHPTGIPTHFRRILLVIIYPCKHRKAAQGYRTHVFDFAR